jgi:DNA sulfur modification protein DndD
MKSHLSTAENSLIEEYEKNEELLLQAKANIRGVEAEVSNIEKQINRFDISAGSTVNPNLEEIKKIEPLFDKISSALLREKKKSIEETLCEDLNSTLTAYLDQIDRVELSDEKGALTFKMYHKKGNEIYLNQLNAASKQVLVQVLLKSLHLFGDYNPPVMIDTVMGYLDSTTRDLLLQNYFPQLSHQTILLSTDSEISVEKDLPKIENYVSRKYTLVRDVAAQQTSIKENYFNH